MSTQPPATQAATTPVKKTGKTVKDWITSPEFQVEIAKALPSICTPDRFLRVALTALIKTPNLAKCDPKTVLRCLLDCGSLGIEPDGRRAYLIPFENRARGITECTLIIGYQGLAELVRRAGDVTSITAEAIRKGDKFTYGVADGRPVLDWSPDFLGERGDIIGFFATATLKAGGYQCAVMSVAEVNAIRDNSNAVKAAKRYNKETPWDTAYGEMGKKTVTRRLCKMLPLSPDVREVIDKDDDGESAPRTVHAEVVSSAPALDLGDDDLGDPLAAGAAGKESAGA